jgi:hypothetical protein
MASRSGSSSLTFLVCWGGVLWFLGCSSPEKHDAPATPSCEASSTCVEAGTAALPPITDPQIVSGPCVGGQCGSREGGTYEGSVGPAEAAVPEAAPSREAAIDNGDASGPGDGGPG